MVWRRTIAFGIALSLFAGCSGTSNGEGRGGNGGSANSGGAGATGGDGQGGNAGQSGSGAAGGRPVGVGGAGCQQILVEYAAALEPMRSCTPGSGSSECQHVVPELLGCACQVAVREGNVLNDLRVDWFLAGCPDMPACPECTKSASGVIGCSAEGLCELTR